jgi:hypothetical protein
VKLKKGYFACVNGKDLRQIRNLFSNQLHSLFQSVMQYVICQHHFSMKICVHKGTYQSDRTIVNREKSQLRYT